MKEPVSMSHAALRDKVIPGVDDDKDDVTEEVMLAVKRSMKNDWVSCEDQNYICDVEPVLDALASEGLYKAGDIRAFISRSIKVPVNVLTGKEVPSWAYVNDLMEKSALAGIRKAIFIIYDERFSWVEVLPDTQRVDIEKKYVDLHKDLETFSRILRNNGFKAVLENNNFGFRVIVEW